MNRFLRLYTFCLTIGISKSGKQITRIHKMYAGC